MEGGQVFTMLDWQPCPRVRLFERIPGRSRWCCAYSLTLHIFDRIRNE